MHRMIYIRASVFTMTMQSAEHISITPKILLLLMLAFLHCDRGNTNICRGILLSIGHSIKIKK